MSDDKKHAEVPELRALQHVIRTRMNDLSDDLIGGGAKDYAEYRYQCGQIYGLAMAERELLDLDTEMMKQ